MMQAKTEYNLLCARTLSIPEQPQSDYLIKNILQQFW